MYIFPIFRFPSLARMIVTACRGFRATAHRKTCHLVSVLVSVNDRNYGHCLVAVTDGSFFFPQKMKKKMYGKTGPLDLSSLS